MAQFIIPKYQEVKVRIDGSYVALVTDNTTIKIPWQMAKALAKAIVIQAGKVEEMADLKRVISDQAFMFRSGAPFGLSNNLDILKEAAHEAQYNDELRKQLPGGVKSTALVGTPTVIKHPPKKEVSNGL